MLSVNTTVDTIHEIILYEEEQDPLLIRRDFIINITGGTNAMGAAALLASTLYGTKAHYVREPQRDDPKNEKYVDDLPVFPIAKSRLNENQLKVLKIIAEGSYEVEGPNNLTNGRKVQGSITRTKLLEELGWNRKLFAGKSMRREGDTRLLGITKKLIESGLIVRIPYTEKYVNTAVKSRTIFEDEYTKVVHDPKIPDKWIIKRNDKEIRFEITSAGKRQAKDSLMF